MTIMSKRVLLTVVFCWVTILGCSKIDPDTPKEYFTQWNSCTALTALQEYVQDVTNPSSANYIVISMKNDFKTIYGPGVRKVDFTF